MLRTIVWILLGALPYTASAQEFALPFEGRWFVAQGGDTPIDNHHMAVKAQWYGIDFVKVGGTDRRALTSVDKPSSLEHFYSWNEVVLAPADGVVVTVGSGFPDNPLGVKDVSHPFGNYVSIRTDADTYVFLAHLKTGSAVVKVGDRVSRRQIIGRVGNSGNGDFPHLHMHVQDTAELNRGEGLKPVFTGMDVELNGKVFEGVTWPLIHGQFVQAR